MVRKELCEIVGCGCHVMGCEEGDGCPGEHLCMKHLFLLQELFEPTLVVRSDGVKPSDVFGQPNRWEREKLRRWYAGWREKLSVGGVL